MRRVLFIVVCLLTVLAPRPAQADVLLTPFAGVSFLTEGDKKLVYGAGVAWAGLLGVEAELGRTTLAQQNLLGSAIDLETSLTTGMVNLMLKLPVGPVQPYVTGGLGVIRVSGEVTVLGLGSLVSLSGGDFGMNVGGGLYVFPSDWFGFRGDVRYFRTITELTLGDLTDFRGLDNLPIPKFDFWRVTGGITLRL